MLKVTFARAFRDNYIWLIHAPAAPGKVVVVDPGDAQPVEEALARDGLELAAIFATHHHHDHVGGIAALSAKRDVPVFGPRAEDIPRRSHALFQTKVQTKVQTEVQAEVQAEGQADGLADGLAEDLDSEKPDVQCNVAAPEGLGLEFKVLDVPAHTAGHIALAGHGAVFCGDTLFSAGCGRLFEGTPEQMVGALGRLAELPDDTQVYCGHEYTEANLRFALHVDPGNQDAIDYLERCRARLGEGKPTLPSTIGLEKRVNPFLRCDSDRVRAALKRHTGRPAFDTIEAFAALRAWKDSF